jgi:GntR family transcriptional repressor for pyruvate dehydrogenase complex
MEVRFAIETEIAGLAARRANDEDLKALRVIVHNMETVLDDVEKFMFMDIDFHRNLAIISRNILFITIAEALVIPLRHSREETVSAEDNVLAHRQHNDICKSIEQHDHDLAGKQMFEHLKHVEEVLREHGKL